MLGGWWLKHGGCVWIDCICLFKHVALHCVIRLFVEPKLCLFWTKRARVCMIKHIWSNPCFFLCVQFQFKAPEGFCVSSDICQHLRKMSILSKSLNSGDADDFFHSSFPLPFLHSHLFFGNSLKGKHSMAATPPLLNMPFFDSNWRMSNYVWFIPCNAPTAPNSGYSKQWFQIDCLHANWLVCWMLLICKWLWALLALYSWTCIFAIDKDVPGRLPI